MSQRERQANRKWQDYIKAVPSIYRLLAFTIAACQILFFSPITGSSIHPVILVTTVGIYTVLKVLHPFKWYKNGITGIILFGSDIGICIVLVIFTGGIHSPFLLYTLTPVLTAALLLDRSITFTIAALSGACVVGTYLGNPAFLARITLSELSYFLVYIIAVCLTAILPYLTNVDLRKHLQSEDIISERKRLSREIHDGTAQTLTGLRWKVQLLRHRLKDMNIDLDEVDELEKLVEQAMKDTRESLELLRNYSGNGDFIAKFRNSVDTLGQNTDINCQFNSQTTSLHLDSLVEFELLRICQEALTNVKKHSGADNVEIQITPVNNHIEVSITDNGCGFDVKAINNNGSKGEGHGLAVMQERAELIGGQFLVLSAPGRGTEVKVELPLNSHHSNSL